MCLKFMSWIDENHQVQLRQESIQKYTDNYNERGQMETGREEKKKEER